MAKGNMLLGMSRGSVGDVTFYRSGGSQRARARNRNPAQPKTEAQQVQRSRFANAVKFYKQFTTNFFRFAYEDKKVNESDYNAFMRHNVVNSGFIGAQASKIANWPALGTWQMSSGSLPEIVVTSPSNQTFFVVDLGIDGTFDTIAQLSTALINTGLWYSGDIITIVLYRCTNASNLPTIDVSNNVVAFTSYLQFVLDETDTSNLSTLTAKIGNLSYRVEFETAFHVTSIDDNWDTAFVNDLFQCGVIHSRNTDKGLLVSDCTMTANKSNIITSALADSGTYYNDILADWDASQQAILQGAAAQN